MNNKCIIKKYCNIISLYKKQYWELKKQSKENINFFIKKYNTVSIVSQILLNRNIFKFNSITNFLYPKIKNYIINPFLIKDMGRAAIKIAESIKNKKKIIIFADYDVDGATSSVILEKFLCNFTLMPSICVPCRLKDGYGPSIRKFQEIINKKNQLIITVDCGTLAFRSIEYAQSKIIDVIVIDHHLGQEELPEAYAIVNINKLDDNYKFKNIAAVGLVFLVIIAIKSIFKKCNYFNIKNITEPNIIMYLDLVAMGTVCDIMPLLNINRSFVKQGLKLLNAKFNLGIKILSNHINLKKQIESNDLGYIYGPRINAGGRIGNSYLGYIVLSTNSYKIAYNITNIIEKYNKQRKSIQKLFLDLTLINIKDNSLENKNVILVYGKNWHYGVLGIIASRIKEIYQKPAFIISTNGIIGKGSCRSIKGVDIRHIIAIAKKQRLLIKGGGHRMAAGFSIEHSKINDFYKFILNHILENQNYKKFYKEAKILKIDAFIKLEDITKHLMNNLKILEPFGHSNEKPRFLISGIINKVLIIAKKYILITIINNLRKNHQIKVKCFVFDNIECIKILNRGIGKKINLVGNLQYNFFKKNIIDFIVEDFSFHK